MNQVVEDPEEKVAVDMSFVNLVHDEDAVPGEERVSLQLSQKET